MNKSMIICLACAIVLVELSEPCQAATFDEIGSQLKVCERERVSAACLDQLEFKAVASSSAVKRLGNLLQITTKQHIASFESHPNADAGTILYRYLGFIKTVNYHVVMLQAYENNYFILISSISGEQTRMDALPHISPSGNKLISVSASESNDTNGISVWTVTTEKLVKEYVFQPTNYALYSFVAWDGDSTIQLTDYTRIKGVGCPKKGQLVTLNETLTLIGSKWHLTVDSTSVTHCN